MKRKRLTDATLKALKPAAKRYDVWDEVVPGLSVCVSQNGRKTFSVRKRLPGAKNAMRRTLDEYGVLTLEEARDQACEWLRLIKRGVDPVEEVRRAESGTFASVAEAYIAEHLSTK